MPSRQKAQVPNLQYATWQKYMDASSTFGTRREGVFVSQKSSSEWKFLCRIHRTCRLRCMKRRLGLKMGQGG